MQFLVVGDPTDPAGTMAQAQALTQPDETALDGIQPEERAAIVNFLLQ
jgi:hypothetical protein